MFAKSKVDGLTDRSTHQYTVEYSWVMRERERERERETKTERERKRREKEYRDSGQREAMRRTERTPPLLTFFASSFSFRTVRGSKSVWT